MFLTTITETDASGSVAEIYRAQKEQIGLVMSAIQCWTARPDLLPAYQEFSAKVRNGFSLSPRDWRLITFVAAKHVPSTYCSHVYGRQLVSDLGSRDAVIALQHDHRQLDLSDRDVEMLSFAEQVAVAAHRVDPKRIEQLRSVGFSDVQIADIALCAAFRCFVSRYFDALGAGPESIFIDEDPAFQSAMTVGRQL